MGSVEELCGEVALLNRGEVVLSGDVQEMRNQARDGRIVVGFRGTVMAFTVAIGASAELLEVRSSDSVGRTHEVLLRLPTDTDVAKWIHWISGHVEILSCSPWQPTMRDIFIETVENREKETA